MYYYKIQFSSLPRVLLAVSTFSSYAMDSFEHKGKKPAIELTYLMRNSTLKKVYKNGREVTVETGQTNVRIPFEVFTQYHTYTESHQIFTMIFTGYDTITRTTADEVVRTYRSNLSAKTSTPLVFYLPEIVLQTPPKVEGLMRKMSSLYTLGPVEKDLRMISCLLQLLSEMSAATTQQAFQEKNQNNLYSNALYSKRAIAYISEHISERITVTDLAEAVGISNEYLSRLFKKETGQTLVSYINMMKLETIKELMDTQYFSLKEAGRRVGIENEAYLNRLFKNYTGITSTEYRKLRHK